MKTAEVATTCDGCGEVILYGETCWAVKTGEWDEQFKAPVMKIKCSRCYWRSDHEQD